MIDGTRRLFGALFCLLGAAACTPSANTGASEYVQRILPPVSGVEFQSADIQALQADEFGNPGLLWVDSGKRLWSQPEGQTGQSCAACHGPLQDMRGVAARYPAVDGISGTLLNLTGRILQCRNERQRAPAVDYESPTVLALTAALTHASQGLPYQVAIDGSAGPYFEQGRRYFYQRRGQMNLACHHCHELNVGRMLRGDRLSQGQSGGYPGYRLQWETLGSLHRRLRFCNTAIRAEPFAYGAPEYVALELYLAWRAGELPLEAPAVRR